MIELPRVTVKRGGIAWGTKAPVDATPPRPTPPPPPGAGEGQWLFGVRDEDGDIRSTWGAWDSTPFRSAEEALEACSWADNPTVVRRWVPKAWEWVDDE